MVNTLNPPASVILSWPKANYVNPSDQGPGLFIICILFSIVGVFLVSARIYSRLFLTRAPGIDDAFVVLGTVLAVGLSTLIAIGNKKYFSGRHVWDVPLTVWSGARLNAWMCEWFYLAAATSIKISILLFYRRLSVSFSKSFLIATWAGIAYNIAVWLGFVIALLNLCRPIKAYWMGFDLMWSAKNKWHCDTEQLSLPLSGALSVVGDLYATLLPMFMINTTVRSPRQKIGLYLLFGLGFLSVVAGIVRTILLYRLINVDYDFHVPLYYMWIVTVLELYFAIFAASAPALKPFFKRFVVDPVSKVKSSTIRSGTAESLGHWNSTAPWSHTSSTRDGAAIDLEKVGIVRGVPQKTQSGTHSTWVELQSANEREQPYEHHSKRYSKMVSFPEERSPSIGEIAVAL